MSTTENPAASDAPAPATAPEGDVYMTDAAPASVSNDAPTISEPGPSSSTVQPEQQQQPSVTPAHAESTPAQSPAPTPSKTSRAQDTQGGGTGSRAQSAHPDQSAAAIPAQAAAHGAPVRQYLNKHVTGVLLEGMKIVGKEQPADPLRVLGEFLLQKSKEIEGK